MAAHLTENRRVLRTFGGAGAVLASALALSACEPPIEAKSPPPPAIVLSDVTLRHYPKAGEPRMAHADSVTFDRESAELHAETITADVPPAAGIGRGGARFEAPSGKGDIHGQRAEAYGKLQVETGVGDRGETVGAIWDAVEDTLSGATPVKVRGPGYRLDGKAFRFRVGDQRLELDGGVQAASRISEASGRKDGGR